MDTLKEVNAALQLPDLDETLVDNYAREMNDKTIFKQNDTRMYFYVREGFSNSKVSEGFCRDIKVTSEMLDGEAIVDGWFRINLSIGDVFSIQSDTRYNLNVMKLELF